MGLFDKYRKNNLNESVDWEKSMDRNDSNLKRIKRLKNLQVDVSPVMGDALEDAEKLDKNSKEVFTKLAKDASSIIPKDPGTGKKVTIKPYTEKLTLDENLFKESIVDEDYNVREYSDQLYDMIEDDTVDAKKIAEDLIYWCSEDDIKEYMRVNDLIFDDEDMEESFSSKNQRCFIIRDKESGDYDRICGISYNDALRKARIKKYEVDFIGEENEEYDESLEKKSLEDFNLLEYANEEDVADDDYTVYDLLNDRLFGYGINKSNFRVKWKFAEVDPTVKTRDGKLKRGYFYPTIHQDELTTGKRDDRRAFTEDGIGVFVHDEDEASLVKKCAEELNLDFVMKKLVRPHNGFNYIATIKVSDDIQEMPIKDYMESIGKSMSDLLRGKGDKIKSNFKDSKNYQSRKINKERQKTAE